MRILRPLFFVLFLFSCFGQTDRPSKAELGDFSDQTIEDQGKITRLDITARVHVTVAGSYRLSLDLTAPNGGGLTGHARQELATGDQTMTVSFTAEEIRNYLAHDGPYAISDVRLVFEKGTGIDRDFVFATNQPANASTRAYRLTDLYQNAYAVTGEFEAEGIDIQPSGKFGALRARIGVLTPGASCTASARLTDQSGAEIDSVESGFFEPLSSGKGMVEVFFRGPSIAAHGVDGPWVIPRINISCQRMFGGLQAHLETRRPFRTPSLRASDFDNPPPDFAFSLSKTSYRAPPGGRIQGLVQILMIGRSDEPVALRLHSSESRLKLSTLASGEFSCRACWRPPMASALPLLVEVPAGLTSGNYTVEVTGRRNGLEHTLSVTVIVDEKLLDFKKAIADLVRPDPPLAPPEEPRPRSVTPLDAEPQVKFSAELTLRKIHAVLVLEDGRNGACELLRASAVRFSRLLVDGRDSLAIVNIGTNAQVVVPLSDHFPVNLDVLLKKLPCGDWGHNTGAGLQLAREQLIQYRDPDALDAVILITFNGPANALTAKWVVNQQANGNSCAESHDGSVTAIALPRYTDLASASQEQGPMLLPTDIPDPPLSHRDFMERLSNERNACFGYGYERPKDIFTSIPERDENGVLLTGSFPLERWPTGPHANEIRIDRRNNLLSAAANQVENIAKEIRSQPESALVYAIAATDPVNARDPEVFSALPESLRRIANDPQSSSFNPDQAAGLAILFERPQAVWPALEHIRQDIVTHASIK